MSNYRALAACNGWVKVDGYELFEIDRQEYKQNNCIFAVGLVDGHQNDTHYLWIEKEKADPVVLLLRADELATISWLCSGALWSKLIGEF